MLLFQDLLGARAAAPLSLSLQHLLDQGTVKVEEGVVIKDATPKTLASEARVIGQPWPR